jgi:hypothetical protein
MKNHTLPTAAALVKAERLYQYMLKSHKALKMKRKFKRSEWTLTAASFFSQKGGAR